MARPRKMISLEEQIKKQVETVLKVKEKYDSEMMKLKDLYAKRNEEKKKEPLHLFCIPAYTHQIPNGISSHRIRDNLYIISKKNGRNAHGCGYALNPSTHIVSVSHFAPPSSLALLAARRPKRP